MAFRQVAHVGGRGPRWGKNITPPGEDLGNDIEFIPVGDQGVEALVNPGHEGPNNDIYINPGHQGPGSEILGNPGSDQGTIINADDPGTDQPQDGLEEGSGQLSLFDEQQFRVSNRGSGGKAFASANGTQTMSGWADPVPEGISRVSPNDVLELQQQMGFPARQAGALDNGNPGAYFASHAERQMALLEPNAPIDVSSGMCSDCQSFFQALATYRGVSQQVTDPDGTRIFNP